MTVDSRPSDESRSRCATSRWNRGKDLSWEPLRAERVAEVAEGGGQLVVGHGAFAVDQTALGLARIEAHYFVHDLFLPPGGLLGGMDRIAHIPAEIVQGRYDMVCPARTAYDLAEAWTSARLTIVQDAGVAVYEDCAPRQCATRCATIVYDDDVQTP